MPTKLYVVLASAESDSAPCYSGESLISFSIKSKNQLMGHSFSVAKKNKFDSTLCQSSRSLTYRFTYFANISAKTNLSAKQFQPVNQGLRWARFRKKKEPENLALLPLSVIHQKRIYSTVHQRFRQNYADPDPDKSNGSRRFSKILNSVEEKRKIQKLRLINVGFFKLTWSTFPKVQL